MNKELTREDVRKMIDDNLTETIRQTLDSALIFKYISELEKDAAKNKEALGYINKLADLVIKKDKKLDVLAVLMTLKAILEREGLNNEKRG